LKLGGERQRRHASSSSLCLQLPVAWTCVCPRCSRDSISIQGRRSTVRRVGEMFSFVKLCLMQVHRRLPVADGLRHNAATLLSRLTKLKTSRRLYCKKRLDTLQRSCYFVSFVFSSEVSPNCEKKMLAHTSATLHSILSYIILAVGVEFDIVRTGRGIRWLRRMILRWKPF
jgi:hypothetical protein